MPTSFDRLGGFSGGSLAEQPLPATTYKLKVNLRLKAGYLRGYQNAIFVTLASVEVDHHLRPPRSLRGSGARSCAAQLRRLQFDER